jgi:hypothetical protein
MPAGTIALGTAVAGLFGATAAGATAFAIGFATQTAIGLALYALSPKPKLSAGGGYLITGNGAALDHQIIYGRTKVAGVRVFDTTEGNNGNNKFLHRVIAFTGHEIEEFEKIYIDGVEILSRDGDGNVTSIDADDSDRYDGFVDIHEHLGSPDQTVDSLLKLRVGDDVNAPDWGDNHRLRGVSYLYIRMKYDADVFPSGIPEITALIKGKKVYDPRTGTTAWSDNSALCIRDYISSEYGLGEENGSIDDTSVATAADICDQSVTDANDSSVSSRYTCNGAFTTDQQPVDILEGMATSMAGILWYAQGQWRMKPGYWTPPTLSLDEDDFIGPIRVNTRHSRRDNFNGVRGTYRGAASDYQQTDYPSVQDAGSLAADNDKESWADLNLAFTDTPQMSHRVARIALEQNRQQLVVQADFNLKAFKLQIGDVVNITNSRFGWSSKEFEVISWSFGVGQDLAIPVTMTLRETAESIYDQVADGATYELDNTSLASPFTTQTPVLGSPVINKEVQEDGTTLISVDFSWSVTDASEIVYYDFEWKLGGASDYNSTTLSQTTFSLTGLNNQTTYDYRVRSVNQLGIASPYASSSVSTGKDTTTPKAPTNVSVNGGYRLCTVRWDAPNQNTDNSSLFDLYQHKVYRGATSGFTPNDSTNLVGIVSADYFNDGGLDNNTTYHYKVKAIDYSGNESAASGSGSGTTQADISSDTQDLIDNAGVQTVDTSTATGAYNGQIVVDSTDGNLYVWDAVLGDWVPAVEKVDLTGAVDVADFAAGIAPPTIVTSLPASGDYQGQIVFLTSDNKLYRWTGSEWTVEVDGEDIVANSITTGKLAVGAVGADQIAANAITTEKLAVGDFSSKVTNYTFSNSGEGWDLDANMSVISADSGSGTNAIATMPTPQALRANIDASELITDYSMSTPVVPGEKYLLSFDYAGVGSSISRVWRVQVYFRDTEGNFLSLETNDQTVTTTTWTETTREITVPSGAAVIYLVRIRAVASGSSNQIYITNVRLRNISSGVLIEDGSITANKIITGGIDAQDLIVDGTITGVLIEAGTIEADKIKIDNVTLDTDGSGNLIVSDNGIDFTQIANNAVSNYLTFETTIGLGGDSDPEDYVLSFSPDHDGVAHIIAAVDSDGTKGTNPSWDFVLRRENSGGTFIETLDAWDAVDDGVVDVKPVTGTFSVSSGTTYYVRFRCRNMTNFTSHSFNIKGVILGLYR